MTTAQELKERFHQCMPLFIALGDEMRLSIIEVLTAEAMDCKQQAGPIIFEDHAPVSYTHLDVYKRQGHRRSTPSL